MLRDGALLLVYDTLHSSQLLPKPIGGHFGTHFANTMNATPEGSLQTIVVQRHGPELDSMPVSAIALPDQRQEATSMSGIL